MLLKKSIDWEDIEIEKSNDTVWLLFGATLILIGIIGFILILG